MTTVDSEAEVVVVAAVAEEDMVVAATMTIVEEVMVGATGKKSGTDLLQGGIRRSIEEEGVAAEVMVAIDSIVATVGTVAEMVMALRPVLVDPTEDLLLWLR